jgi:cohesin complex subunit SCC1
MRLLEIRADPIAHFLPTKTMPDGHQFLCAAPPGMAPELADMFLFPVFERRRQRDGEGSGERAAKRARTAASEISEPGMARRAGSETRSHMSGAFFGGADDTGGWDAQGDHGGMDVDIDVPMIGTGKLDIDVEGAVSRPYKAVEGLVDDTRSTPGFMGDEDPMANYDDLVCPIGIFDLRPQGDKTQTQTQDEGEIVVGESGKGFSQNTVRALGVIQRELRDDGEEVDEGKVLSFNKVSQKVCLVSLCLAVPDVVLMSRYLGISPRCLRILLRATRLGNERLRKASSSRTIR